jgi:hypothetical protein
MLQADVTGELDGVSQRLTGRVKLLTERYAVPSPKLTECVAMLSAKADPILIFRKLHIANPRHSKPAPPASDIWRTTKPRTPRPISGILVQYVSTI